MPTTAVAPTDMCILRSLSDDMGAIFKFTLPDISGHTFVSASVKYTVTGVDGYPTITVYTLEDTDWTYESSPSTFNSFIYDSSQAFLDIAQLGTHTTLALNTDSHSIASAYAGSDNPGEWSLFVGLRKSVSFTDGRSDTFRIDDTDREGNAEYSIITGYDPGGEYEIGLIIAYDTSSDAEGDFDLPALEFSGQGSVVGTSTGSLDLPALEFSGAGATMPYGAFSLPMMVFTGSGSVADDSDAYLYMDEEIRSDDVYARPFYQSRTDIGTAWGAVGDEIIVTHEFFRVLFRVTITSGDMDGFKIQIKTSVEDSDWEDLIANYTDYNTVLRFANDSLDAMTDGDTGAACVNIFHCYAVRFLAKSTSLNTTVTVDGVFSRP